MEIPHLRLVKEFHTDYETKYSQWVCTVAGEPDRLKNSIIFPARRELEVKQVRREAAGNTVVFLKGLSRRFITPGSLIVPREYAVSMTNTAYGICLDSPGSFSTKDQEFSIRSDSFPLLPSDEVSDIHARSHEHSTMLSFSRKVLLCPGSPYRLIDLKGRTVTFIPMITRQVPRTTERFILKRLSGMRTVDHTGESIWLFRARALGYSFVPADLLQNLEPHLPASYTVLDSMIVYTPWLTTMEKEVMAFVRKNPGKKIGDISRDKNIDRVLIKHILDKNVSNNITMNQEGLLYLKVESRGDGQDLSPAARNILNILQKNAFNGIAPGDKMYNAARPVLQELISKGYAVHLANNIVFAVRTLQACSDFLKQEIKPGQNISLKFLKERLNISRRYVSPLVDRLVGDGVIVRTEDGLYRNDEADTGSGELS